MYLKKNDWMAYPLITNEMLEDLLKQQIGYRFKADIYNSIISEWYLMDFFRINKFNTSTIFYTNPVL
jgi:hypothetical protein